MTVGLSTSARNMATHGVSALALSLLVALAASCGTPAAIPVAELETEVARTLSPPTQGSACEVGVHGDLENLDPTGQITTYWHPYVGANEELLHDLVDEFNRTNKSGIVVLAESHDATAKLHENIEDGIASGRLPDLTVARPEYVATYAQEGVLAATDCYAASSQWGYPQLTKGDFYSFALASAYVPQQQTRYGWPSYSSADVLYYNQEWLVELGFDGPPVTWDEFAEHACAAAQQPFSDARGEGIIAGYEYLIDARRFATFILSRGGALLNENTGEYAFGGTEGLDTLAFLKDLTERGCASPVAVRGDDQTDFSAGRVLFAIAPVHHLPRYQRGVEEVAGFGWGIAPPPHHADLDAPTMLIHGPSYAIFRSSPERQLAAWLFVQWMNEPEQQARWAIGTSYYPTRPAASDLMDAYFAENTHYEQALDFTALDFASEPAVAGYDQCRVAIEQMLTAVLGGGDPQAALDAASAKCGESLQ